MTICKRFLRLLGTVAVLTVAFELPVSAAPTESEKKDLGIKWQEGPSTAELQQTASVKVPEGYKFADGASTRRMMQALGEPSSGREMGLMVPTAEDANWSVFFEFSPDGYVKDDDKDKLDADKLLKAITQGNDRANQERKRMGNPPLNIVGWEQKPNYDPVTHNLEWAIRAESMGRPILNYNTRLLGRRGVMQVVLVCDPDELSATLPKFKDLLSGYSYQQGETYAEYRPGDKVAKYGLAALITGGAVAVAAKTGLLAAVVLFFKKAWKLLVIGLIAILGVIKKLFGRASSPASQ